MGDISENIVAALLDEWDVGTFYEMQGGFFDHASKEELVSAVRKVLDTALEKCRAEQATAIAEIQKLMSERRI